jgi:hypothetical protein
VKSLVTLRQAINCSLGGSASAWQAESAVSLMIRGKQQMVANPTWSLGLQVTHGSVNQAELEKDFLCRKKSGCREDHSERNWSF